MLLVHQQGLQQLLHMFWLDWCVAAWASAQTCLHGGWLALESSKAATDPLVHHVPARDLFALVHQMGLLDDWVVAPCQPWPIAMFCLALPPPVWRPMSPNHHPVLITSSASSYE